MAGWADIVVAYKFNEAANANATAFIGGKTLTQNGSIGATAGGLYGNKRVLGASKYFGIANDTLFDLNVANFEGVIVVDLTGTGSGYNLILSKQAPGQGSYRIYTSASGNTTVFEYNGVSAYSGFAHVNGRLYVFFGRDGTTNQTFLGLHNGTTKIILTDWNGSAFARGSNPGGGLTGTAPFNIGAENNGTTNYLDGSVTALYIVKSRKFTQAERDAIIGGLLLPFDPQWVTSATQSIVEGNDTVFSPEATSQGDDVSYEITGGADSALFNITGTTLYFNTPPDYENPTDSNSDNVYVVEITASNTNYLGSTARTFNITVTDDAGDNGSPSGRLIALGII